VDRASVPWSPLSRGRDDFHRVGINMEETAARVETNLAGVRRVRRPRQWLRVFSTRLRFVARAGLLRHLRRRDDEQRGRRRRRRWRDIVKFGTLVGQRRHGKRRGENTWTRCRKIDIDRTIGPDDASDGSTNPRNGKVEYPSVSEGKRGCVQKGAIRRR
jgi:hypothetical protein